MTGEQPVLRRLQDRRAIRISRRAHSHRVEASSTSPASGIPQRFHLDVEAAKESPYGGLIASGFHSVCAGFRMFAQLGVIRDSSLGSPGGIDELRWLKPVRPGDTLRSRATVREHAPVSQSRNPTAESSRCSSKYSTRTTKSSPPSSASSSPAESFGSRRRINPNKHCEAEWRCTCANQHRSRCCLVLIAPANWRQPPRRTSTAGTASFDG